MLQVTLENFSFFVLAINPRGQILGLEMTQGIQVKISVTSDECSTWSKVQIHTALEARSQWFELD